MISSLIVLAQQLQKCQDKEVSEQIPLRQDIVQQPLISSDPTQQSSNLIDTLTRQVTDDYLLILLIQVDQIGETKYATHRPTKIVRQIKMVPKSKADFAQFMEGLKLFSQLDHPNIAKFDSLYDNYENIYAVVQPFLKGELYYRMQDGKFNEQLASETMFQVLNIVNYLHSKGIVHQDIKPDDFMYNSDTKENLFLTSYTYLQELKPNEKIQKMVGEFPFYIAPEVINSSHDFKCDIWSCGILLYTALSGLPPFLPTDDMNVYQVITKGEYSLTNEDWSSISDEAKDLIKQLLQSEPEKRITAKQALNHPWIQKYRKNNIDRNSILRIIQENVKVLKSANKIQRTLWNYIANNIYDLTKYQDQIQVFQQLDKNFESALSKEILQEAFNLLMNAQEANQLVNQIFQIFDRNQNNIIDYSEYVAATLTKEELLAEDLLKVAFQWIDDNQDGKIDFTEFNRKIKDKTITEQIWNQLINQYDVDGDHQLNEAEFLNMMNQLNSH